MKTVQLPTKTQYRLAQITDCHLLADPKASYRECQPASHLAAIIATLVNELPDAVIFTGDLTQDHSAASYQLLAQLCQPLTCPVFLLPGNHDDLAALADLSRRAPFCHADAIGCGDWQLFLLNSKGHTPAGEFDEKRKLQLSQGFAKSDAAHFWLFSHHHPYPLDCFIDKHGLLDYQDFWHWLAAEPRVRGIAHGHAHMAYHKTQQGVDIVGCPASSVQFLATADWQTVNNGPQWCEWHFSAAGAVSWQFKRA